MGPKVTRFLKHSFQSWKAGADKEKDEEFAVRTEQAARMVAGSYVAENSTCTPVLRDLVMTKDGLWGTYILDIDRFYLPTDPAEEGKSFEAKSLKEQVHEAFVYLIGIRPDHVDGRNLVGLAVFDDKQVNKKWAEGDDSMAEECRKATTKIYGGEPIRRDPGFLKQHLTGLPDRLTRSINEIMRAVQISCEASESKKDTAEADAVVIAKAKSFIETYENEIEALKNLMEVLKKVPEKIELSDQFRFDFHRLGQYYKALIDYSELEDSPLSKAKAFAEDGAKDPKDIVGQFSKALTAAKPHIPGPDRESVSDSEAEAEAKVKAKVKAKEEADAKARAQDEQDERGEMWSWSDDARSASSSDSDP